MIAPRGRLVFWAGMAVPFAAIGVMAPSAALPSAAVLGIMFVLAVTDIMTVGRCLKGINVEFPEVLRASKDHDANIDIRIRSTKSGKARLRLGLRFPDEVFSDNEEILLEVPGGVVSHFQWRCKPLKRGSYLFDVCYLEGLSYLGFWSKRSAFPVNFELRAYPDLSFERKNLAALFLNRGNFGIHARRQTGLGREFEKLREYVRGDSFDHIHWKAAAKRGRPITKVFQIERTQEVYVIVDSSRLSSRRIDAPPYEGGEKGDVAGSAYPDTILERFVTAALIMGIAARRQGDLFGVLSFSNKVRTFVRAKGGRGHYNVCRDELYRIQPQIVTPDFEELCSFIGLKLRRRALLVFLTNLDDPAISESFTRDIELICRKHLVLVATIKSGHVRPLFSNTDAASADDIYQDLGGHMIWHDLMEVGKVLQRRNVRLSPMDSERLCSGLVSQYMEVKQRQLI